MKYLLALVFLIPITSFSQEEVKEDSVHRVIAISPEFPGGPYEMSKFIGRNFEYPEEARINGEQGTIWVEFVVMANGILDSIKVVKGVSKSLDAECIRVIKAMPKWRPGEQAGKPICVKYTIPFKAKIAPQKKKKKLFKRK